VESRPLIKLMRFRMSVVLLYVSLPSLCAQTSDTQSSDANKSWTATTESQTFNTNPTRAIEAHRQSGNRTMDSQSVERLGLDGHYEPYFDTEKESVQVSPPTTRTVVRTFSRDASGQKTLTQVKEEERETLSGGNEKMVRITSNSDGNERTTEERISRPGSDDKLSVVSYTLGKESKTSSGEKRNAVETYSTDIPGSTPDGKLHLSQRVSTVTRSRSDGGKQTDQQLEQPNPGDPNAGLRVTIKTVDIVQPGASGMRETHTIDVRDATDSFGVVPIDTRKSDKVQAVTVDISPEDKPK
jgi:hypothetical protein